MDRKSKQKIKYILWVFVAVAMVMLFFCGRIRYEGKIREEQIQELIVIYPEIQNELYDNFLYYQEQAIRSELIVMAVLISFVLIWGSGLVMIKRQENESVVTEYDKELDFIYEQLVRFQKGDFKMLPLLEDRTVTDKWKNLYERLRELGYFFSDLKTRLTAEENSTKSLITDISHQLKTPLASIRMCHDLAEDTELSEEERKDFLATEAREIRKMELLLDELVKISRLENNMIQIKPERNSLKQTLREAVGQIFMKAHAKNIKICVDMEEDVEIVHDRKWMVEAFVNILENAVKYSEQDTSIDIRVSYLPSNILLEMEDEGMGIPEAELHEIFKRFYRGSNAKKVIKDGAGVGLYLARSIIEQQGGTIVAKRKSEHGTIFKIMLPLNVNETLTKLL
uniref:sensor histidine kinase n=1 Tax=Acetatifactor sp. TaxID=1872090 RepID=UPI00405782BD